MIRNRIERTASKKWRGTVRRVICAAIYNLSCFAHGCSTGWVSAVLGSQALSGGAWLAALPCLTALPSAPFIAALADVKGRKVAVGCTAASFCLSWMLAAWCGSKGVWAARAAAGVGGAGALTLAPVYCVEIAPKMRGLAAMPALASSLGILFAFSAGGVLSAHALSLTMVVAPSVLLVSLVWLPETPCYLINVGRVQEAASIICWFDGSDFREDLTDVIEQQEVRIRTSECYGPRRDGLYRQDSDTFQPMLKRSSGLDSGSDRRSEPQAHRELFRHRQSRRALISCCVILTSAAGTGAGAVKSFAAGLMRDSIHATVPPLNVTAYNLSVYNGTLPRIFETSEAASMLCGTALVLGAAVATVTVDKVSRKMLLICSCSGIACCLALLGVYCDPRLRWATHLARRQVVIREKLMINETIIQEKVNDTKLLDEVNRTESLEYISKRADDEIVWPPIVLLSSVMFLYNVGLGSVPFVLVSELFSVTVRSLASSLLMSWMWLNQFLLLRYYGTIAVSLGLHTTYYISASVTLVGGLFVLLFLPETKGRSQQRIDEALNGVRKRRNND